MSEYSHPESFPPPANAISQEPVQAPAKLPMQASKAKSALRISGGVASICVGFCGASAALALNSAEPRFACLGFLLEFTAVCSVVTGFVQVARDARKDLRVPALLAVEPAQITGISDVHDLFPAMKPSPAAKNRF